MPKSKLLFAVTKTIISLLSFQLILQIIFDYVEYVMATSVGFMIDFELLLGVLTYRGIGQRTQEHLERKLLEDFCKSETSRES